MRILKFLRHLESPVLFPQMCLRRFLSSPVFPLDPGTDRSFAPHVALTSCECAARLGVTRKSLVLVVMHRLSTVPFQVSSVGSFLSASRSFTQNICLSSLSYLSLRTSVGGCKTNVPTSPSPCFFFFEKKLGILYGTVATKEAREVDEIKVKSIERRRANSSCSIVKRID
jgi:hypothetical protein